MYILKRWLKKNSVRLVNKKGNRGGEGSSLNEEPDLVQKEEKKGHRGEKTRNIQLQKKT